MYTASIFITEKLYLCGFVGGPTENNCERFFRQKQTNYLPFFILFRKIIQK
jgi:hypothetical protein